MRSMSEPHERGYKRLTFWQTFHLEMSSNEWVKQEIKIRAGYKARGGDADTLASKLMSKNVYVWTEIKKGKIAATNYPIS